MKLDTIKLALESSALLLERACEGGGLSEANTKSVNATIHVTEKMLRDILHEEMEAENDDQEEDD